MKTLAEIEKIRDELIEECKRNTFVDSSFTATVNCRAGFDACLTLMLERENVAKECLEWITTIEGHGQAVTRAEQALEKLK